MMGIRRWLLSTSLLMPLLLAGCGSNPVSGVGAQDEDTTGQLGSPVKRTSPADVYVDLGTVYLRDGNLTEAFKNARKAVMLDERSSSAHNLLGLIHQRFGENAMAEKHYRRAVELEPQNPYALNALGSFVCSAGAYEEADGYFKRALRNPLYPTPWVASHNAGRCAERAGLIGQAEAYYRAALQRNPHFAPSLLRMAHLSFDSNNYLSARAYVQRFEQVGRDTAESLWLGLRIEKQLGDMDQVASYSIKLRENFPDSEQARFLNEAE